MDKKELTPRKLNILKAIVDAHITYGEPVGSKYLSKDVAICCSPATIRNEMADLENMGYLIQPHTSAGRVPSEAAYKLYVESLINQYSTTKSEIDEINEKLKYKLTEMDQILQEASRIAASVTDYTGIAFKAGANKVRVNKFNSVFLSPKDFLLVMSFDGDIVKSKTIHLSFSVNENVIKRFTDACNLYLINLTGDEIAMPVIMRLETLMGANSGIVHPSIKAIYEAMNELDSADIKLDGITKLLEYPEYKDVSKLKNLLGVLEEKDKLMDVINTHTSKDDGIHVYMGDEDDDGTMPNTTMIFRNITVGGNQLAVGVIGPRRMNYEKVIGMINQLASGIDRMLTGNENLLLPDDSDE